MKISIPALLAKIAGGALVGLGPILGLFFPKQATIFNAAFGSTGIVVLVTGLIVQSMQPVQKLTDDAYAVNAAGVKTGDNVTTTTKAPIMAPQALTENPTLAKGP
jgi:hypothetical protein